MFRLRSNSDLLAGCFAAVGCFFAAAPFSLASSRLTAEPSVFLQAQVGSPVDWMAWGPDAFARAKTEKKPVLLAVGTSASELSRAMARQSFANVETGKFLNEQFVCVLVDAKERPDVAALYQNYLQIVKQVSGPPMNIWLTPELKPFEGANYLPPTEEWGKEGFVTIAKRVAAAWTAGPAAQAQKADEAVAAVVSMLQSAPAPAASADEITRLQTEAVETWKARFDATNGGFGDPPKYAEPELLRFLLRDAATQPMALTTLRAIIRSPMRDVLDGGFFRYGSDAAWRQPYFQKILADQPRLALALLDAAEITSDREFADAARAALHFALDHLSLDDGGFSALQDGTGEDLTASYFWSRDEIQAVLGEKDAAEFCRVFGVTAEGNLAEDSFPGMAVKGRNALYRTVAPGDDAAEKALAASAAKLLKERNKRPAPRQDDAATSGAHGLLLAALARAGAELPDARLAAAAKAEASFIQQKLRARDGGLLRLGGRPVEASPSDYALVAEGALIYHRTSRDAMAQQLAEELIAAVNTRFWDDAAGRYFAIPASKDPAFWARVYSPTPTAGEPPTVEPTMLAVLIRRQAAQKPAAEQAARLLATLLADAKAATDPVRGDVLLALAMAQSAPH